MRMYQEQIVDMKQREVARKVSEMELQEAQGLIYYISYHEVWKPTSESTPYRIIFNSSQNWKGHTLNNYWVKGTSLINNLEGIIVRFRGCYIGFIGDNKKMFHSI